MGFGCARVETIVETCLDEAIEMLARMGIEEEREAGSGETGAVSKEEAGRPLIYLIAFEIKQAAERHAIGPLGRLERKGVRKAVEPGLGLGRRGGGGEVWDGLRQPSQAE